MFVNSGAEETQRTEPAASADDVHAGTDAAAGGRVPTGRVRESESAGRTGRHLASHRNPNQNLVSESTRQRQTHRESSHRPPLQVSQSFDSIKLN